MDKSAPTYTTPGTYIDIENRIIDKYLPHIGVYVVNSVNTRRVNGSL